MGSELRTQILTAAEQLFRRFGYRKATVAEIARAAGMAKGAIYLHFPSKEEIFLAIVSIRVEALASEMEEVACRPGPPRARIQEALEYFVERTLRCRLEFFPGPPINLNDDSLVVKTLDLHKAVGPKLKAMLERRVAGSQGLDPAMPCPEEAAWLLVQTLFNLVLRLVPDPGFDYGRYLERMVQMIIRERTTQTEAE